MLVYQMGKVGSTALAEVIPGSQHFHTLYGNQPCPYFQRYTSSVLRRTVSYCVAQPLKRIVLKQRKHLKIISIVREPTSRNMSMFFQDLPFWITGYVEKYDRETRRTDLDWLWNVYVNIFNHEYVAQWFDKEIKRFTGIDVLAEGFDKANGYSKYKKSNIELLVFRLEDIDKVMPVLEDFSQTSLEITGVNKGENKWYSGAYKEFTRKYRQEAIKLEGDMYSRFRAVFGYE